MISHQRLASQAAPRLNTTFLPPACHVVGNRRPAVSSSRQRHHATTARAFEFRHFTVQQDMCAHKVGTDSMLLGAWADPGPAPRILDIGTGTGVLALMMAQKAHPDAAVHAIDVDEAACRQAQANAQASPWSSLIHVHHMSLQQLVQLVTGSGDAPTTNHGEGQTPDLAASCTSQQTLYQQAHQAGNQPPNHLTSAVASLSDCSLSPGVPARVPPAGSQVSASEAQHQLAIPLGHTPLDVPCGLTPGHRFDVIISNPPYFRRSTKAPGKRGHARHADESLPYEDLAAAVAALLQPLQPGSSSSSSSSGTSSSRCDSKPVQADAGGHATREAPLHSAFFVVLPASECDDFIDVAHAHGLKLVHQLRVRTRATDTVEKRRLLKFRLAGEGDAATVPTNGSSLHKGQTDTAAAAAAIVPGSAAPHAKGYFPNLSPGGAVLDETMVIQERASEGGVGYVYSRAYKQLTRDFHSSKYLK